MIVIVGRTSMNSYQKYIPLGSLRSRESIWYYWDFCRTFLFFISIHLTVRKKKIAGQMLWCCTLTCHLQFQNPKYRHWFKSCLLHFHYSSLIMCLGKQWKRTIQIVGNWTHVEYQMELSAPGSSLVYSQPWWSLRKWTCGWKLSHTAFNLQWPCKLPCENLAGEQSKMNEAESALMAKFIFRVPIFIHSASKQLKLRSHI